VSHLMIVLFVVAAFALIIGAIKGLRACFENRDEEMEIVRCITGLEYDRDLIRQSAWSDDVNLTERRTPISAFKVRDQDGSGTTWRNRDRD
jgi:hypothetical protein